MPHKAYSGFSLLELNTVIIVLATLTFLMLPTFKQFLMRQERAAILEHLQTAIEYAKQEAFFKNKIITLCAIDSSLECRMKDWSTGFIAFEWDEENKKIKRILQTFPGVVYGKLHFEQFGYHLNIEADGTTMNVGTFIYCPRNKDPQEAEALVINKAGRFYRVIARNNLGILLKNAGTPEVSPITCR